MQTNKNPNELVRQLKARYGPGYDYRFLELDNLQREFYFEMRSRERKSKERRRK